MRSGEGWSKAAPRQSVLRRTDAGRQVRSRAVHGTGGSNIAFRAGHLIGEYPTPSLKLDPQSSAFNHSAIRVQRSGIRTHVFGIGALTN